MILKLRYYGDPVLRQKCERVNEINDEIRQLVSDIVDTFEAHNGIGLAASQVGVPIRLFVLRNYIIHPDGRWTVSAPIVYINPKITPVGDEVQEEDEGCLSIPGLRVPVERPYKIIIEATDLEGRQFTEEHEFINARTRMHENDHLNGVLQIDRTDDRSRKRVDAQLQALKKKYKPK